MEEKNYCVYSITAPTGDVFLGISSQNIRYRLNPVLYRTTSLQPYIGEFGWDRLEKRVVEYNITKEEAQTLLWENACFCRANGVLINKRINVPLELNKDRNRESQRKWRETHREELNRRCNEYYWRNRDRCIARQIEYNNRKKGRTVNGR